MKKVYSPQLVFALFLILTSVAARAVVGPVPDDLPEAGPSAPPAPSKTTPPPTPPPAATAKPAPIVAKASPKPEADSVDQIKGIGKYVLGAKLTDFAPVELQPVDPRAKGKLLRVSPYGQNYLVTNLTGLSWGNIPLSGLIVTFHDDTLIDIQIAMRGKKVDFYLAERAFKDKYGPSNVSAFPVEIWGGCHIQVTLVMVGAVFSDPGALDKPAFGKVEILDKSRWSKVEAAQKAQLKQVLNRRYQQSIDKVKSNL